MKSLLSHHEIALLLLLLSGPGQVSRTDPDAIALQQAQLVEVASEAPFERGLRLTAAGKEVLRRLGIDAA
ncbi:hypothetical protein [Paraburkholderia mimosarum]|uniref:hypothetical protein n=1 Tax=Paraburkholderia mimosarum TaxID=312026 RepID=UPI00056ADC1A|nr:hypothetical protein [Paraburkholderia mimosarum]